MDEVELIEESNTHRCQFEHISFRLMGFRFDGTNQCWMTNARKFGDKYLCIFHMPTEKVDAACAELQSSTLVSLIKEWNKEEGTKNFVMAAMQCGSVDFSGITFKSSITFHEATFSGPASFVKATFKGSADFQGTTFSDPVWFVEATFSGSAWFVEATFNRDAFFLRTKFGDCAAFEGTTFSGDALFTKATFDDDAWFSEATFAYKADFNKTVFEFGPSMGNCFFKNSPSFHGATLAQDVDFLGTEFNDTSSRHAPSNYRTIKVAMNKVSNKRQEAVFYGLEQKSLRKQDDTARSLKFFSFLYEKFSNYGQSTVRPIISLFIVWGLFFTIYLSIKFPMSALFIDLARGTPDFLDKLAPITKFTTINITSPFRVWIGDYVAEAFGEGLAGSHGVAISMIASLQTILSLTLITLFILALRRTFKLN